MNSASRLFASLARLGINPKMETFAERKRVQKVVYLLDKVFEINFNYAYSWYLQGPYSPQVTQIVFSVIEGRHKIDSDPVNLSNEDLVRIERMKTFLKEDLYSNDALELLVSVDYLLNCVSNSSLAEKEIIEFLNVRKPYFTDEEIVAAIRRMRSLRSP